MRAPSLFHEIDASLAALIPPERVELRGEWLPVSRRSYQSPEQLGTGSGPFVDVVDLKWRGVLSAATPIAGIALLVTGDTIHWSKSQPASVTMPLDMSLSAYADYSPARATFTASLGGAFVPGVPVECGSDLGSVCQVLASHLTVGRVQPLARAGSATFAVLLLPGPSLQVGRHRLWRVRDTIASSVPPAIREILTRRRSGTVAATDALRDGE